MQKALIDTASGKVINTVELADDWTGSEGEWQAPDGQSVVDVQNGEPGDTWDGDAFVKPVITTDQAFAKLREERNRLLYGTDWWASSDLEMSQDQIDYRQALRDLPANTADPHNPTWPTAPE